MEEGKELSKGAIERKKYNDKIKLMHMCLEDFKKELDDWLEQRQ